MNLNSLSLVVDFGHLSSEGFAALILAIIFTIVSLAFVIYFFRHKGLSQNKIWLAVIILCLPALSIFCWVYLIISITDLGLGACFYISFACAVGYALIMTLLGLILNKCLKHEDAEEKTKDEVAPQETVEETKDVTETETTEKAKKTKKAKKSKKSKKSKKTSETTTSEEANSEEKVNKD